MTRNTPLAALLALAASLPCAAEASCLCMLRRPPTENNLADDPKNPATSVFILRDGTRTVLTVEPAYEGPLTELSMIVPLPTPIAREDVRTISGHHFRRVDRRTAPRVSHTWESCDNWLRGMTARRRRGRAGGGGGAGYGRESLGVEIEESWDVDEYDVSLLSASESSGLLTFLRERGLELPDRAAPLLRSYIETGHRFALVEVDPSRAETVAGRMVLSPLQLHYDSEELRVPVRLGTLNSPGEQELLLYVLSRAGRYGIANREALLAPAGASLREDYEGGFGAFYGGLMDELFRQHPGGSVTEYARSLGGWHDGARLRQVYWFGLDRHVLRNSQGQPSWRDLGNWTLTRIRHRYGADLDDDIVLRPAEPIAPTRRGSNNFAVRFEVRHESETCPSFRARQALTGQWATASALWAEGDRPWPGDVLLEPVFGIEPGSSRPVIAQVAPTPAPEPVAPSATIPTQTEPVVAAASCATRPGSAPGLPAWGLLGLALLWGWRARRH